MRIDNAGRVVWCRKDQDRGAITECRFNGLKVRSVLRCGAFISQGNRHAFTSKEFHQLTICKVVGFHHRHSGSSRHGCADGEEQGTLGAWRDDQLAGSVDRFPRERA